MHKLRFAYQIEIWNVMTRLNFKKKFNLYLNNLNGLLNQESRF
jgi:hypothetical protein